MSVNSSPPEGGSLRRVHSTGDIGSSSRQSARIGSINTIDNLPPILPALVPLPLSRTSTLSRVDAIQTLTPQEDLSPSRVPTITEELDIRSFIDTVTVPRPSIRRRSRRITIAGLFKSLYTFFGYGPNNRARKELVSLIKAGIWTLIQVYS